MKAVGLVSANRTSRPGHWVDSLIASSFLGHDWKITSNDYNFELVTLDFKSINNCIPENCFGEGLWFPDWFDDSWRLFTANFLTGMGGNSMLDSSDGSLGAKMG